MNIRKIDDMRLAASLIVELHASLIDIEPVQNSAQNISQNSNQNSSYNKNSKDNKEFFVFVLDFPDDTISKVSGFTNLFYQKILKVEVQRFTKTYNFLFAKCKDMKLK